MTEASPDGRVHHVSAQIIQRLFNESDVPAMIADGRLTPQEPYLYDQPLSQAACQRKGEPPGTRSQIVRYFGASRRWVVEIHRYLRPDGRLGGSGLPDPKRLRLEGHIYVKI